MNNRMHWVFDLDGTLVDTARTVVAILNDKRRELGLPEEEDAFFHRWLSLGGEPLIANALCVSGQAVADHLGDFRERYAAMPTPPDSVYAGVADFLAYLKAQGAAVAVCTNKPRGLAEKVLRETDLVHHVEFMCAGGDLATQKPHPDNLRQCLVGLRASTDSAIMIGDSTVDQQIAASCGVPFYFFSSGYSDGVDRRDTALCFGTYPEIISLLKQGRAS